MLLQWGYHLLICVAGRLLATGKGSGRGSRLPQLCAQSSSGVHSALVFSTKVGMQARCACVCGSTYVLTSDSDGYQSFQQWVTRDLSAPLKGLYAVIVVFGEG